MLVCRVLVGIPRALGRPSGSTSSGRSLVFLAASEIGHGLVQAAQADPSMAAMTQEARLVGEPLERRAVGRHRRVELAEIGLPTADPEPGLGVLRCCLAGFQRLGEELLLTLPELGRWLG